MDIAWYGLSCFRLTERGMASVVTDPFDHNVAGYGALKLRADIVTISHDAPGHNNLSAVRGREHVLTGPGEYEIGGVFITAIQTDGRTKKNEKELRNTLYVFDYNGVTVAHLGDMQRVPSQTQIETMGQVDVALVPVGGGSVLSAAKAVEVVSLIEPGIVVPMHYKTQDCKIKLAGVSSFLKEMGVGSAEPQPSLKVTPTSIPSETHVVVLDYGKS